MTMRVSGPGGVVVNFPDGTDAKTIDGVMTEAVSNVHGQALGKDVTTDNVVRSVARGVPVVGGILDQLNAATNATIAGAVNPFYKTDIPQENWADRYNASLGMQRGMDAGYAQQHPYANAAGEIAGGVAGMAAVPLPAVAEGAGLGTRMAVGAATGAGVGGADAFTRDQGDLSSRLAAAQKGAEFGGVVGGAVPAVTSMVSGTAKKLASAFSPSPTITPTPSIHDAADAAYTAAEKSGMTYTPEAYSSAVSAIKGKVADFGGTGPFADLTSSLYPKSAKLVERLSSLEGTSPSLMDVNNATKIAGGIAKSGSEEGAVGSAIRGSLRDFVNNTTPEQVASGDVGAGVQSINDARDLWKQYKNAETFDAAMEAAKNKVSANYTSAGMLTALRQEFKKVIQSNQFKFFSPEQQSAIQNIVDGDASENTERYIGMMAPKGAIGQMFNTAMAVHNPAIGIPLTLVSSAFKGLSNSSSLAKAKLLEAMIKNGSAPVDNVGPKIDAVKRLAESYGGPMGAYAASRYGTGRQ